MFDFAWTEIALIGIVALIAIGPKDMPVAIRAVSGAIKKARKMAGEFQTHVDEMVREANLDEVRSQFSELRSFNVRNQIEKHVDPKGELRSAFSPPPLVTPPPAAATATAVAQSVTAPASTGPLAEQVGAVSIAERMRPPVVAPLTRATMDVRIFGRPAAREAPAFIPPAVAAPPPRPAFIPPGVPEPRA